MKATNDIPNSKDVLKKERGKKKKRQGGRQINQNTVLDYLTELIISKQ